MTLDDHCLIGARIVRQYRCISADEMAQRLGIKRTSYLRLERGERQPLLTHAIAMSRVLNCTIDQLTRMPTPDEVRELYAASQQNNITPIDDTTGEMLAETVLDNRIIKVEDTPDAGIVVDATHTPAPTHQTDANGNSIELAQALAGWEDSE